jgi:hypothetical protein
MQERSQICGQHSVGVMDAGIGFIYVILSETSALAFTCTVERARRIALTRISFSHAFQHGESKLWHVFLCTADLPLN